MNDVATAAEAIIRDDSQELAALRESILLETPGGLNVLEGLSKDRRREVRDWAAGVAAELGGGAGIGVLVNLGKDRDTDVSQRAIEELIRIAPESAKVFLKRLRRRAESRDTWDSVAALWALAELRDSESTLVAERVQSGATMPFQAAVAEAVKFVLAGDSEALATRLRGHPHDQVHIYGKAVTLLPQPSTLAALAALAESAPDDGCRKASQYFLDLAIKAQQ